MYFISNNGIPNSTSLKPHGHITSIGTNMSFMLDGDVLNIFVFANDISASWAYIIFYPHPPLAIYKNVVLHLWQGFDVSLQVVFQTLYHQTVTKPPVVELLSTFAPFM